MARNLGGMLKKLFSTLTFAVRLHEITSRLSATSQIAEAQTVSPQKVKCVTEQHHNEVVWCCRDALTRKSSSPDGRKHICLEPDKCHVIMILIVFAAKKKIATRT